MNKSLKLAVLLSCTLLASCSDNLNNSNAKSILQKCFEKKPEYKIEIFKHGSDISLSDDDLVKYQELNKQGVITLSKNNSKRYSVEFTNKADDFLEYKDTASFGMGIAKVRTLVYDIDEVKAVHEMPNLNVAKVDVVLSIKNKTPFSVMSKDDGKSKFDKTKTLIKTSNGWSCDK